MGYFRKTSVAFLLVLALLALPVLGCGDEDGEGEKVVITVGLITDHTGPGATPLRPITYAIEDLARHINEEDSIPGVELKIVSWDTKYDPSRDIAGYNWCRDKGAKLIITPQPHTAEALKYFAERDKVPICTYLASDPMLDPPGWVFCASMRTALMAPTVLKWISEQWPNYPTRPKVATCGCSEPAQIAFAKAVKEYCQANPDKFDFVAEYFVPMGTMTWSGEVEKLKDCDYIGFQQAMPSNTCFVKEFRDKGYTAKMFDLDAKAASRSLYVSMCGWEGMDGSLSLFPWGWWGDAFATTELAEELLYRYRAAEAEDIIYNGNGYLAIYAPYLFFDIVRQAVEEVGAENFDGQAFYNVAIKFKRTYAGFTERAFTETVRYFPKEAAVYEWRADVEDLVRVSDWLSEIEY